ncbi:hypothetical protein ES705_29470 [subsurface metagenome]
MKFSELKKKVENDGWYIYRTKKHHIYRHLKKSGQLTISKNLSKEVPVGTLNQILKAAGLK